MVWIAVIVKIPKSNVLLKFLKAIVFVLEPKKASISDDEKISNASDEIIKTTLVAFLFLNCLNTRKLIVKNTMIDAMIDKIPAKMKLRFIMLKNKKNRYAEIVIIAPWAKLENLST